VQVSSGEVIEADVVVTATGFDLAVFGDIPFTVDGEPVDFTRHVTWRGLMISDIPNMAYAFGYFRHSWTLRIDLVNDLIGRILARMDERGDRVVVPTLRAQDADMPRLPWVSEDNFNPGYIGRSSTACSGRATVSPGPTCTSTTSTGSSCRRPTSTTACSTADPTDRTPRGDPPCPASPCPPASSSTTRPQATATPCS
jgi:hypothetical protein